MTSTHEQIRSSEAPGYDRELLKGQLLDYFYGSPEQARARAAYEEANVIPTNNLYLYFLDQPVRPSSGPPRAFDYTQYPFGEIFEVFKKNNSDLWEEARRAIAATRRLSEKQIELLYTGKREEARTYQAAVEAARWEQDRVFSRVFDEIAPRLVAAGFDPLEATGAQTKRKA